MSTYAAPIRPATVPRAVVPLAAVLAAGVGALAAVNITLAVLAIVAVGLTAALAWNPASLLVVLATSIFLELVNLGGVTVSRLLAPIALCVVAFELIRGRAQIRGGPPLIWAFGYSLWALASGLWTVELAGTIYLLASLVIALVYMVSFAALLESTAQLRNVLYVLCFAALLVGANSIAAFGDLPSIGASLQAGRAQGGVGDPSFFAAFQLVVLPVALVLAGAAQALWLRLALYGTVLVILASVLTSLSRGGFIALALVGLIVLVAPARTLFRSRQQKQALVLLMVAGIGFLFTRPFVRESVVNRVKSVYSQDAGNTQRDGSGRLNLWLAAQTAMRENPVLGMGYGTFRHASTELMYRTPGVDFTYYKPRPYGAEAHSLYLGTLAEIGPPGLILFLGMLISTAAYLRRTARRARAVGADLLARLANAFIFSLLAWALASLFLSTETSRAVWIVVGIALALPKLVERFEREGPADTAGA